MIFTSRHYVQKLDWGHRVRPIAAAISRCLAYFVCNNKMAEIIDVSEAQLRFVTNTSSGMGLIKCGSVVIPFDNQISKDTDLYKLYNTNIHEKIAEQKKRDGN